MMKTIKKIAPWILYGLVAVFIFLTLRDNYEEVKQYRIDKAWLLIPATLVFSVQVLANAWIWDILMRMAKQTVSTWNSILVYISSFVIRYIPGSLWAVAARAAMNKPHGVKAMTSIWGWVIENVTFMLVGLVMSVLVLINVEEIPQWVIAIVVVGIPASFLFLMRYEWVEKIVEMVGKKAFPDKAADEVVKFDLAVGDRLKLIGLFALSWLIFSAHFYLVADAVANVSTDSFFLLAGVNALAWCIGFVVIVAPSGAGIKEAVIILALPALGITGEVDAVVIALLARMTAVLGEVAIFGAVKGANFLRKRNEKRESR
jgi:glycosyltransferase 2 family protein